MAKKPRGLHAKLRDGKPYFAGTVQYPDGTTSGYIFERAGTDDLAEAEAQAKLKQDHMLKEWWFGGPKGGEPEHTLADAIEIYLKEERPNAGTLRRLERISEILKPTTLNIKTINQDTVNDLEGKMFTIDSPELSTVRRAIIVPLKAVLQKGVDRGWLAMPKFKKIKKTAGRTDVFTPEEAERLIAAAAPHLKALIIVLMCTGMRLTEALYLPWRDVNLQGGFLTIHADRTKGGKRRVVWLTPRAMAALANLTHRQGMVFRTADGSPYAGEEKERLYGGQIKTAWNGAKRRAGLDDKTRELTPHTCRHSWASYHYAIYKDLLKLQAEGGWSDIQLVTRYAHIMEGYEDEILNFLGGPPGKPQQVHQPREKVAV